MYLIVDHRMKENASCLTSSSSSYALFLQNKDRINKFCLLSIINQMQDVEININNSFWSISTLHINKKVYITCLLISYLIKIHLLYDIIYLPDAVKQML